MAYVDLNPVRADLAETRRESEFLRGGGDRLRGASCEGGVGGVGGVWPGGIEGDGSAKAHVGKSAWGKWSVRVGFPPLDAEEGGGAEG